MGGDGGRRHGWGAFWRIVLPVSLPGLAAAGVLGFILAWNEFLFALVLTGPTTATIPVALAALQSQNGVQIAEVSAGVVLGVAAAARSPRASSRSTWCAGLTFGGHQMSGRRRQQLTTKGGR